MNAAQEILLGPEAWVYFRQALADGKTLSHCVLERTDLRQGRLFTLLPPGASTENLNDFMSGGKLLPSPPDTHVSVTFADGSPGGTLVPIPNANAELARHVEAFLKEGFDRLCILEDQMAEPGDPAALHSPANVVVLGPELYYVLGNQDADVRVIEDALCHASSSIYPPLVGVLTHGLAHSKNRRETTTAELRSFAERAEEIVVGAYDGEGYVLWSKS